MKKRLVFLVGLLVGLFVLFVLTNSVSANGPSPKPKKATPAKLEEKIAKLEAGLRAGLDSLKERSAALRKDHNNTMEGLKKLEKRVAEQEKRLNTLDQQRSADFLWLVVAILVSVAALLTALLTALRLKKIRARKSP